MQLFSIYLVHKMLYMFLGGSSAHHQGYENCTYSVRYFDRPVLLPSAIVEEMELVEFHEFHLLHYCSR